MEVDSEDLLITKNIIFYLITINQIFLRKLNIRKIVKDPKRDISKISQKPVSSHRSVNTAFSYQQNEQTFRCIVFHSGNSEWKM